MAEPLVGLGKENGFHDAGFILEGDEFHGIAGSRLVATGKTPTAGWAGVVSDETGPKRHCGSGPRLRIDH